jgi:hypothetical protein
MLLGVCVGTWAGSGLLSLFEKWAIGRIFEVRYRPPPLPGGPRQYALMGGPRGDGAGVGGAGRCRTCQQPLDS